MTVQDLIEAAQEAGEVEVDFVLPGGVSIPAHAHITEVARVDRRFIDCGGEVRQTSTCVLQAWVADDIDHRVNAEKLAEILGRGADVLGNDSGLEVEIEFEHPLISQFPVESSLVSAGKLRFFLGEKHTDCLAKDVCLPPPIDGSQGGSCGCGPGCC